jgi:hypothetical protein
MRQFEYEWRMQLVFCKRCAIKSDKSPQAKKISPHGIPALLPVIKPLNFNTLMGNRPNVMPLSVKLPLNNSRSGNSPEPAPFFMQFQTKTETS